MHNEARIIAGKPKYEWQPVYRLAVEYRQLRMALCLLAVGLYVMLMLSHSYAFLVAMAVEALIVRNGHSAVTKCRAAGIDLTKEWEDV